MQAPNEAHPIKARAERYFTRTSFSQPVFIGEDRIALMDDRSGTNQLSVMIVSTGEMQLVTTYPERLLSLLGSAASGRIVFGMDLGGNERQQLWSVGIPGDEPKRLTTSESSFYEPGAISRSGDAVIYRTNERDESTFDIVVQNLESGEEETWLKNGGQVTPVDIVRNRALVIRNNGNMDADLLLVTRDGETTVLTDHSGEQWVYGAALNREGTGIWLLSNRDREYVALMFQDIESGKRRIVFETDWDVEHFSLSPNGAHIAFSINENGASRACLISTATEATVRSIDAPQGVIDQFSWCPDSSAVVFGLSTIERPSAVFMADLQGGSRIVANGDDDHPPATIVPVPVTYQTWDGRDVHGFFFKPEGAGPFPGLVEIHGGPESQRRLDYGNNGPALQFLASLGIAVLALNVRGSTGYGKEYCHLDDKEKRLDALRDVEYAVKWLHEHDDVIDSKIAVYGISYGGFMTLSSLARYPELWAAGVEMVGMASLVTFLERTGAWRRKHREGEYGELATDREMLNRVSPLPHVDKIAAPLMVFHGRQDARVPIHESEQIVDAVKERGLEVILRIYDDEGHVFSKRPNLIDAFSLIGAFLTRHLDIQYQR